MKIRQIWVLSLLLPALAIVSACRNRTAATPPLEEPPAAQVEPKAQASQIKEDPPVPDGRISAVIKSAVAAPDRPEADRDLDAGRRPAQMMAFFGISPGMKVADLFAGGGYTTELLSRCVGEEGKVYSRNGVLTGRFKKTAEDWKSRLSRPALKNVIAVEEPWDAKYLLPAPADSLDAVLINMNYHDMVGFKVGVDHVNAEVFRLLKPGGIYGIVDHSAAGGSGARDTTTLHRIDEDLVIRQVEAAGFKLAAASSALRHPEDDRTWFVFKRRGQTDRFMLKFVKPE